MLFKVPFTLSSEFANFAVKPINVNTVYILFVACEIFWYLCLVLARIATVPNNVVHVVNISFVFF